MCVVLGGPIWPVPSLGLTELVSVIPRAFLTLGGLSWTEVQVHDNREGKYGGGEGDIVMGGMGKCPGYAGTGGLGVSHLEFHCGSMQVSISPVQ